MPRSPASRSAGPSGIWLQARPFAVSASYTSPARRKHLTYCMFAEIKACATPPRGGQLHCQPQSTPKPPPLRNHDRGNGGEGSGQLGGVPMPVRLVGAAAGSGRTIVGTRGKTGARLRAVVAGGLRRRRHGAAGVVARRGFAARLVLAAVGRLVPRVARAQGRSRVAAAGRTEVGCFVERGRAAPACRAVLPKSV